MGASKNVRKRNELVPLKAPPLSEAPKGLTITLAASGHRHPRGEQLDLFPIKETEADGIRMGVLSDGSPYLTLRGLAKLCGVAHSVISRMAANWNEERLMPRGLRISELLDDHGHRGDTLGTTTTWKNVETHVYVDSACMAILEYYAFEAGTNCTETAKQTFRDLARLSLRAYIYRRCGFNPEQQMAASWRNYQERILLNDQMPPGFFSVFREMADIVVRMIGGGCPIDSHTVPDISVGKLWSEYWRSAKFDMIHGPRKKHPHEYPDWFPQSNAHVEAWVYPNSALGAFRDWLDRTYLRVCFPKYLDYKVKKGDVLRASAMQAMIAVERKALVSQ